MKKLLLILFVLMLSFGVFGQPETKIASPAATPEKTVIRWNAADKCCDNWMEEGELVTAYDDGKIQYITTLNLQKDYIVVWFGIANTSDRRITIDPASFSIRMTEPVNQSYSALNAEEVAKKIKNKGQWKSFFNRMGAGMARKQSSAVVTDQYGNTANVQITEPDTEAQNEAERKIAEREAQNSERASSMSAFALKANTLFKDKSASGYLYFPRKKIADGLFLQFVVEGVTYEIPYGAERKKQAEKK